MRDSRTPGRTVLPPDPAVRAIAADALTFTRYKLDTVRLLPGIGTCCGARP
ncbi:MAG TPA: hypothetical protein PKK74_04695 [Candidatus Methanoculleus thermohydrogenotrophicum]|nr:hypothetical protein [Candidatus Methanoculleus thermohydrogenotrophicum]NLM81355.1 hypothetical protein [Candidatus Methanoculleus thermohydrogenotrophicum]HOB17976.1 hypothetical protein [Candidatus Methanoculleus thermohydrogenotrophicum]HPZ38118.1 hypothetical protein [Candidatus Methanoculleus thermohydrogenotrophicum]HQC91310.1 hypothetical protein [Candidatus Methanoculleus thermohydrogenotrophicum]